AVPGGGRRAAGRCPAGGAGRAGAGGRSDPPERRDRGRGPRRPGHPEGRGAHVPGAGASDRAGPQGPGGQERAAAARPPVAVTPGLAGRRDASGVEVTLPSRPARIVSLVPSITELLFDLGLDARIVGVTRFCVEPRDRVAAKAKVGREKDPDVEKIRALAPDLVVANIEENRRDVVEQLRGAGIPVWVTYPRTVREGIQLIRELGAVAA